jgi:hypothetical protein
MSGGQYLTPRQKAIVNRFYEHADTRTIAALQELVSDLALADPSSKDAAKKWAKAADLLTKAKVAPAQIARVCDAKNIKGFAELVATLSK